MSKLVLFAIAALGCLALAGCPQPPAAPMPTSAPPTVKQQTAPGQKPASNMDTGVEAAPSGAKNDMAGGLK